MFLENSFSEKMWREKHKNSKIMRSWISRAMMLIGRKHSCRKTRRKKMLYVKSSTKKSVSYNFVVKFSV